MEGGDRERACRCHYLKSHLSAIPDAAGVSQGRCYPCGHPQCCQGQVPAPSRMWDILTTMNTDCQTKMREEDRQGDEPPLGKRRGRLSCTPLYLWHVSTAFEP